MEPISGDERPSVRPIEVDAYLIEMSECLMAISVREGGRPPAFGSMGVRPADHPPGQVPLGLGMPPGREGRAMALVGVTVAVTARNGKDGDQGGELLR